MNGVRSTSLYILHAPPLNTACVTSVPAALYCFVLYPHISVTALAVLKQLQLENGSCWPYQARSPIDCAVRPAFVPPGLFVEVKQTGLDS